MNLRTALFCLLCFFIKVEAFEKVVIWGHKLHSHTHSYVHNGFYRAFVALDYPTYWFDNEDDVTDFDFSQTLFITEGQVDGKIPLRDDCKYMLHNCDPAKYAKVAHRNAFIFQVYNDTIFEIPTITKVDTCIYYDLPARCLYMPWATDLLPFEIDQVKSKLDDSKREDTIYWVGTIGGGRFGNIEQITPFTEACAESGVKFIHRVHLSMEENIECIQNSLIAPTIVGEWQQGVGYIPCRIFKNISYGKWGVTNSERVNELFEGKLVYNKDTYQLFYDAKDRLENTSKEELFELMDIVKTKHTYLNRVELMLDFLDRVEAAFAD